MGSQSYDYKTMGLWVPPLKLWGDGKISPSMPISVLLPEELELGTGQATQWLFVPCTSSEPKAGGLWNSSPLSSPHSVPPAAAAQKGRVEWDEPERVSQSQSDGNRENSSQLLVSSTLRWLEECKRMLLIDKYRWVGFILLWSSLHFTLVLSKEKVFVLRVSIM